MESLSILRKSKPLRAQKNFIKISNKKITKNKPSTSNINKKKCLEQETGKQGKSITSGVQPWINVCAYRPHPQNKLVLSL